MADKLLIGNNFLNLFSLKKKNAIIKHLIIICLMAKGV